MADDVLADVVADTEVGVVAPAELEAPVADIVVLVVIIGVALISQYLLRRWQRTSARSFHAVTLIGLWVFPFLFALYFLLWRLLAAIAFFTIVTAYLLYQVYSWFSLVHRTCYLLAIAGYALIMLSLFAGVPTGVLGFNLGLYGLYFGVLSRDLAEFTAENVAVKLGYYSGSSSMPHRTLCARICALCDQELDIGGSESDVSVLDCGHRYHDLCLRGWAMIGKKDTCACCQEKIDLKHISSASVWQNVSFHWCQILDAVRYLVVWNPVIFAVMQVVIYLSGLDHAHDS